jgi:hypothetical protein
VLGFFLRSSDDSGYPTADQRQTVEELGEPVAWFLADGPISPGGDIHRVETWFYAEHNTAVRFLDGTRLGDSPAQLAIIPRPERAALPHEFDRSMDREAVESALGDSGLPIDGFSSEYAGSTAYFFPRSGLLISFVSGRLFTVQTYVPPG